MSLFSISTSACLSSFATISVEDSDESLLLSIGLIEESQFSIYQIISNMGKESYDEGAIYDARLLGRSKVVLLGLQHMFAMFGATVLVPAITGLSVSATLLFAGLGTLLFHVLTRYKVPAFLGSSFAFLGGYSTVVTLGKEYGLSQQEALPYGCLAIFVASLVYFLVAFLIKSYGTSKVMKFF
ncbi:MAG: solute carrier family 23 protein, partial [Bacteroidales bacterium]